MKPFQWQDSPLEGMNLIEASAGTGKTYTIAGLYLRLILEKGMSPENILVVTFTQAATNELQARIRQRLNQARTSLLADAFTPELETIVQKAGGKNQALNRLEMALALFDQAAIFTIHGFCQRILQEFAFESGVLFDTELVADQSLIVAEIAEDFWRRHIYDGPDELGGYLLAKGGRAVVTGPESLVRLWQRIPGPDALIEPVMEAAGLDAVEPFRAALKKVLAMWPGARREVLALLAQDTLNGRQYGGTKAGKDGESRRSKWLAKLDLLFRHLVAGTDAAFPVNKQIQKITTSYLNHHTKKGKTPPQHKFFDLCQNLWQCGQNLEDQCHRYMLWLKVKFLHQARDELKTRKARLNVQYFDDLLLQVGQALDADQGPELARVICQRYKAALVDEFQDTDPVQCKIFNRLFSGSSSIFFMIGDPKQAIYGFRSADIFAYLDAARRAQRRYTLTCNWRSSQDLVEAVNGLFAGHPNPFVFRQIRYHQVQAAGRDAGGPTRNARLTGPPMHLWCVIPEEDDGKPFTREMASRMVLQAVAGEIVELLESQTGCKPQDIAVLTRTNRQALMAKEVLLRHSIPAALLSTGSVFDTREAEQLFYCLAALADPGRHELVKAALATDFLHHPAVFETESQEAEYLDKVWPRFHSGHQTWSRHGFYPMFQQWMAQWQIRQRLLALPDGWRRFTNLIHLGELLHAAEVQGSLSIRGLLQWLAGHLSGLQQPLEQEQLRLENDRGNVLILTAHRSKGLEFEVVFCPFLWSEITRDSGEPLIFHDKDRHWRLIVDLDPGDDQTRNRAARDEILAENLRLIYVCLTRARQRCYLAWGMINKTADSALAYLLHGWGNRADAPEDVARRVDGLDKAGFLADLEHLVEAGAGKIALVSLPKQGGPRLLEPARESGLKTECRVFPRQEIYSRRVASFSSLAGGVQRDELDRPWPQGEDEATESATGLIGFPRGARAGLFFHYLLENIDWSQGLQPGVDALVRQALMDYGFDTAWCRPVSDMLVRLQQVSFPGPGKSFCLGQLKPGQWVNEMEFYLPLRPLAPENLRSIFARYGKGLPDELFSAQMERLDFSPVAGYLRGFMDMVFEARGKFFLVDWKSNDLGPSPDAYRPQRLMEVMAQDYYFLQYCLYTVALDQHLRNTMADYSYNSVFGGVIYVFLRGVALENGSSGGFFHIRPHPGLISDLRSAIIEKKQC